MVPGTIANILHRDTLAAIVGGKVFERGESCFNAGRVSSVEASRGELRGTVQPQERARAAYAVRLWVREDGLAYECTCPMGAQQQFCKHTVAVALAHLDRERRVAEREIAVLRREVLAVDPIVMVDRLLEHARRDPSLAVILRQLAKR